jgi:hypothetical protein
MPRLGSAIGRRAGQGLRTGDRAIAAVSLLNGKVVVSQWNTDLGWPYRAMQFNAALKDTTKTVHPPDPINL